MPEKDPDAVELEEKPEACKKFNMTFINIIYRERDNSIRTYIRLKSALYLR